MTIKTILKFDQLDVGTMSAKLLLNLAYTLGFKLGRGITATPQPDGTVLIDSVSGGVPGVAILSEYFSVPLEGPEVASFPLASVATPKAVYRNGSRLQPYEWTVTAGALAFAFFAWKAGDVVAVDY